MKREINKMRYYVIGIRFLSTTEPQNTHLPLYIRFVYNLDCVKNFRFHQKDEAEDENPYKMIKIVYLIYQFNFRNHHVWWYQ